MPYIAKVLKLDNYFKNLSNRILLKKIGSSGKDEPEGQ